MPERYDTIDGHPSLVFERDIEEVHRSFLAPWRTTTVTRTHQVVITLCAECGEMRSVLFLDKDRWFCTRCRNSGAAAPTMVPITRPRGGRQNG